MNYGQTQLNWLISQLASIPSGNTLLILQHQADFLHKLYDNNFKDMKYGDEIGGEGNFGEDGIIPDIINAWKNGGSLTQTYSPTNTYGVAGSLSVSCDFTARGAGKFACYLLGHTHSDSIGYSNKYHDQKVIRFCSSAQDTWQNATSDLARANGTKAQDAITVCSVDTIKECVNLVRVGSNITMDMRDRTMISIPYNS